MKKLLLAVSAGLTLVSLGGQAIAACTNPTRLSAAQISALVGGNTVCVPNVTVPTMTWQELHVGTSTSTTGALIDFKRGPGHAVDPSETVGTWTVNGTGAGNATITHSYNAGGGSYIYTVHGTGVVGSDHSFCVGATEIVARVKAGGGAC